MNTPDTEWETVDRYSVETGLLKRFFKLYEEGRKTGDPQNFIDYFKAEHYLLIEVGKAISSRDTYWKEQLQKTREEERERIIYITKNIKDAFMSPLTERRWLQCIQFTDQPISSTDT